MGRLSSLMRPQFLEGAFGLAAGVDEDQRGLGVVDRRHHIQHGMARQMPRPGDIGIRGADRDLGLGAALGDHQLATALRRPAAAAPESAAAARGPPPWPTGRRGDGRAPGVDSRASPSASRSPRLELYKRMQFVQHHGLQAFEHLRRARMGHQQRQLFRRGQQNVGRRMALALAARGRRVAGAGLHRHGQIHLRDGRFQIARHVHRQRLQRRDVERVQARACGRVWACPARSIRLGRKPARVLPPPVGATSSTLCPARHGPPAPTDAARGVQPRAANQS